jgi:hypothetical protein
MPLQRSELLTTARRDRNGETLSGFCLAEPRCKDFGVVMERSKPDCKGRVARGGHPGNCRRP